MREALLVIGIIATLAAAGEALSRTVYGRSALATLVEFYLRITEKRYTAEGIAVQRAQKLADGERRVTLPERYNAEVTEYKGMTVFRFGGKTDEAVLYLHGAGYVRDPRKQHFSFAKKLARRSGRCVYMAVYPKAPFHTASEVVPLLCEYMRELSKAHTLTVMGDSSGGGLALVLSKHAAKTGVALKKTVLISPLLDATLSNPEVVRYEKTDPIVKVAPSLEWIRWWAGEQPLDSELISPIFGELDGLPDTLITVGTRETLYPDCLIGYERLKAGGVSVTLYEGKGLNHCFPIYPDFISARAVRKICEFIR